MTTLTSLDFVLRYQNMTNTNAARATRIALTSSQLSAVEIYVTDPAHEEHDGVFLMVGRKLEISGDLEVAIMLLVEAANSADVDGPRAGCTALGNVVGKVRAAIQQAAA